jgi:hypothetical protein
MYNLQVKFHRLVVSWQSPLWLATNLYTLAKQQEVKHSGSWTQQPLCKMSMSTSTDTNAESANEDGYSKHRGQAK